MPCSFPQQRTLWMHKMQPFSTTMPPLIFSLSTPVFKVPASLSFYLCSPLSTEISNIDHFIMILQILQKPEATL